MPIAWHPSRWWDCCVHQDEKRDMETIFLTIGYAEIKNILIKPDVEIWSKRGYNQELLWTKTNN